MAIGFFPGMYEELLKPTKKLKIKLIKNIK